MPTPETVQRPATTGLADGNSGTVTGTHQPAGPPTPAPLRAGSYELLERIGRGGLGDVYRARHSGSGEEVALKLLRGGGEATPAELRSFQRELDTARRLSHPGILPILDAGTHDGTPYYTMPLVRGGSLEKQFRAERLAVREAVVLLARVARAVHAAHGQGVVHRDLKPANVLLADDGTPLVADFGLARFVDQATAYTVTGQLMGSLPYMSPEQAAGRSHTATAATDVWALGVILYEMLAGQRPFRGDSQSDLLHRIQHDEPVPPGSLAADVPGDLEAVCLKCLRKRPRDRYASAADLAADLERWLAGEPVDAARPAPVLSVLGRTWDRLPVPALLACAALLFAALLLLGTAPGGAETQASDPPRSAAEAAEQAARERLWRHLARAAPGRPVVLLAENQTPLWGRLVAGKFRSTVSHQPGVRPWMGTRNRCLYELLPPDPGRGDFRLLLQAQHVEGGPFSEVGLYGFHRRIDTDKGAVHAYAMATYREPTLEPAEGFDKGERPLDPEGALALVGQLEKANGDVTPDRVQLGVEVTLGGSVAVRGENPIRTIALEVRPSRLGVAAGGQPPQYPTPARFALALQQFKSKRNPAGHLPDLTPGGGAGVVVWRADVTIHRVLYEPLVPPR